MPGFKTIFVKEFMSHAGTSDPDAASILEDTLSQLWTAFQEEHERVSLSDLDARYSKFLGIDPNL